MEHIHVLNLRERLTAVLDEASARELVALVIRRIVEAVIAVPAI